MNELINIKIVWAKLFPYGNMETFIPLNIGLHSFIDLYEISAKMIMPSRKPQNRLRLNQRRRWTYEYCYLRFSQFSSAAAIEL